MDYVDNKLLGVDANRLFMTSSRFMDSDVLETVLRYIALKHCCGNEFDVRPITCYCTTSNGNLTGNRFINDANLTIVRARGSEELPTITAEGWVSMDKPPFPVALFLKSASETKVFVNQGKKLAVVFVRTASPRWLTCFASVIWGVLTWLYPNPQEIAEDEVAVFKALANRDTESFVKLINDYVDELNFAEAIWQTSLHSWGDKVRVSRVKELESRISSMRADIAAREENLRLQYIDLEKQNLLLMGLSSISRDDGDDMYAFFKAHPQLELVNVETRSSPPVIDFSICDTIEFYDEEMFQRINDNKNSFMYNYGADVEKILRGVFLENKGVMRVESMFRLSSLSSLCPLQRRASGMFDKTHLHQPHLFHYACLGGNETYIRRYLSEGEWQMAIEQAIAATKNVAFGDGAVMRNFCEDIRNSVGRDIRYIIADNGQAMTAKEFLAYISTPSTEGETHNG